MTGTLTLVPCGTLTVGRFAPRQAGLTGIVVLCFVRVVRCALSFGMVEVIPTGGCNGWTEKRSRWSTPNGPAHGNYLSCGQFRSLCGHSPLGGGLLSPNNGYQTAIWTM